MKEAELHAELSARQAQLLAEKRRAAFESSLLRKELGLLTEQEKEMYARELASIKELERLEAEIPVAEGSSSPPTSLPLSGSVELPDVSDLEPPANWLESGLPAD